MFQIIIHIFFCRFLAYFVYTNLKMFLIRLGLNPFRLRFFEYLSFLLNMRNLSGNKNGNFFNYRRRFLLLALNSIFLRALVGR